MPCLLIYGDTGMGKTKVIRKFERQNPPTFRQATGVTHRPVVVAQVPPEPVKRDLFGDLTQHGPLQKTREYLHDARTAGRAQWVTRHVAVRLPGGSATKRFEGLGRRCENRARVAFMSVGAHSGHSRASSLLRAGVEIRLRNRAGVLVSLAPRS